MANAKQKTTCCLRRFQFSEIEYAKYPSPFIYPSESPVFIGVSEGEGYNSTLHHPSSPVTRKEFEPQHKQHRSPNWVLIEDRNGSYVLQKVHESRCHNHRSKQ